ncbi:hypothetical protein KY331_05265 [Candidatus Woesearchaeota archaeon]|nr:hypothetical protein [Candidatus Woesearchaeota archaeon]
MRVVVREAPKGLVFNFNKRNFRLTYPRSIWKSYSGRDFWKDNVTGLLTICSPLVAGFDEVKYNTATPFFNKEFRKMVLRDIPSAVEDYKDKTKETIDRFFKIKYGFKSKVTKKPFFEEDTEEKAVIPISFGKDSLLTLGVCKEIGLEPNCFYVNDTVSPTENRIKIKAGKKIAEKEGIRFDVVLNEVENLNDFEFWNKGESCVGYGHLITSFGFLALPLCASYKAKYIMMGNEGDLNEQFRNKDGFWTYASYDQTIHGTRNLSRLIEKATRKKVFVKSVIEPLSDIAIMKILHNRYKKLGKFQISCACLDAVDEPRWCYRCTSCAFLFTVAKGVGVDPRELGFKRNMFDKKFLRYHLLFSDKEADRYDKGKEIEEQDMFAFYLAYKNGAKGYLMNLFKKRFLKEAKSKEDKLYKKYFKIGKFVNYPKQKEEILSIYREELK